MTEQLLQVQTTVESRDDAEKLARSLVKRRLAACVQIVGPIASVYWWDSEVQASEEWLCLAKVPAGGYAALERELIAMHPYDVPEVLGVPVAAASRAYADWVQREAAAE